MVRIAVAEQGYGLDVLINDEDKYVRCAVARQDYGLDKLVNDNSCDVRATVAEQGYGLNLLINDSWKKVRKAVAKQGYGLDKLINDRESVVVGEVKRYLKQHNYSSIEEWCKKNKGMIYDKDRYNNELKKIGLKNNLHTFIYKIKEISQHGVISFKDDLFRNSSDSLVKNGVFEIFATNERRQSIISIDNISSGKDDVKLSFSFDLEAIGQNVKFNGEFEDSESLDYLLIKAVKMLNLHPELREFTKEIENIEITIFK